MRPDSIEAAVLQLRNRTPYERNLSALLKALESLPDADLIVAPEVCLTDYDYDHLDAAVRFGEESERRLLEATGERLLVFTRLARRTEGYVNEAVAIHGGRVVHRQAKHRLFLPGGEHRHLHPGPIDAIVPFEVDGVRYGILVCFELRFKELWKRLEGCDVILVPAQWGLPRKRHLEILAPALAVMNQCHVAVADSARADMARSSGFYSPDGGVVREDWARVIAAKLDLRMLRTIRRMIPMGH
ncbi:carbon-nitrogen hydrolase family protein [Nitratifractor sp.]